ncbi:type IX secretion system membrane protein PorP/SprF, partial [Spongiivirga citrea]
MKAQHKTYLSNLSRMETHRVSSQLYSSKLTGSDFGSGRNRIENRLFGPYITPLKRSFGFLTLLIFWMFPKTTSAQEFNLPLNNQYLADNPYLISAAFAGIGDCFQVRLNGVSQWV